MSQNLSHLRLALTTHTRLLRISERSSVVYEWRIHTPVPVRAFSPSQVSGVDKLNCESRRADSNRLPLLITSDRSYVAGVCTGLQIPHIEAGFYSPVCCVLHRTAFSVVSEWYQFRLPFGTVWKGK
jgi:hypothetical protein